MVVTVVSAESQAELEEYFDAQNVNRTAIDFSSLDWYFGKEQYSFVCGWVAKRGVPASATGLKVTFPSPTLWFPLLPTRIYANEVETVVYVRGFVRPTDDCDLPGLNCEYIYGVVNPRATGQVFKVDPWALHYFDSGHEVLTRVTLANDPTKWDRDLELEPGTTLARSVALAVVKSNPIWWFILCGVLGAALGMLIPKLTIARGERIRKDWIAGAAVGGGIAFSILTSLVIFSSWRWFRFKDRPQQPRSYLVLPALAIVHFGIAWCICRGLSAWIAANV